VEDEQSAPEANAMVFLVEIPEGIKESVQLKLIKPAAEQQP
jgi:hypothetical protein